MIAISYRRDDSLPIAGRLYDRLQAKFGKQAVFMDFDSIRPGLDFRAEIRDTIDRADVVIALIGPKWTGVEAESGRRIDNPNDFVRLEIAHALKRDIPIIPVLVSNSALPEPESLPEDIRALVFRHALPLDSGLDFHQHADRVISSVGRLLQSKAAGVGSAGAADVADRPSARRLGRGKVIAFIGIGLVALAGGWLALSQRQHDANSSKLTAESRAQSPVPSASPPSSLSATVRPQMATFVPSARLYVGTERVTDEPDNKGDQPIAISFSSDPKSGTITQSTKHGDFVVRFTGIWEGNELHAVTGDVVAQPTGVAWTPESFALQFAQDGQRATYQCAANGHTYRADLAPLPELLARLTTVYKGTVMPGNMPIRISLAADRKSGTLTETSKSGDTIVTFTGLWDGEVLHVVTGEVVSKPEKVRWRPESFTLRASPDARSLTYTCNDQGNILTANLSAP